MVGVGALILFGSVGVACNRGERAGDEAGGEDKAAESQSAGAIALPASFMGVLPCADCAGIRYVLDIRENKKFVVRMTYLGKGEGEGTSFEDIGSWSLGPDGQMITLRTDSESTVPLHFAIVSPQTLRKLDSEGKEIQSQFNHDLTRTEPYQPLVAEVLPSASDADPTSAMMLENTTWHLADVGGAAIQPKGTRVPNLRIDAAEKRVAGFAGCNRFNGAYELDGQRLRFPLIISTKMACDDLEIETKFLGAVDATRSWRITSGTLDLLGEGGQTLARLIPGEPEPAGQGQ